MATTGFWPVKGRLKDVIDYAENPDKTIDRKYLDEDLYRTLEYAANAEKTDQRMYVSALNCPLESACQSMMETKRRFGKLKGNVAYHGYQSFRPGELTPETCHEIGIETARRMWPDYEVVVTTHLNTNSLHNHFIVNSVSYKTGEKFQNKIRDHVRLREVSDELCLNYELSVLNKSKIKQSEKGAYWVRKSGKLTHRDILKQDVEECLAYVFRMEDIHYFSCSNYSGDYGGTCTSRHYIRADAIEQVVLLELRRLASFLRYDEEAFADILAQKTNRDMLAEQKRLEGELQKAIARNETVVRMYEKLYEDNASGKVTDEWFMQLSHKYEVERMELKNKISDCRQRLSELGSMQQGRDSFLQAIRRFMEMGTLTAPLLQELIDHIDVYETEGKGKHRTQRVVIYYRFVGYIDLSEADFEDALLQQENHRAETRQGVAVEYLPEKPKPEYRPAEEASA